MRLSLLLPCVLVAGMIGVSVFAQSDDGLFPTSEDAFDFSDDVRVDPDLPVETAPETAEAAAIEQMKLRQQYLELIEQKSAHMDRSALREAISRAERDIDELKANAKLQEAKQLLLDLVKSHPGTSAAQSARAMLQAEPIRREVLPTFDDAYEPPNDGDTYEPSTNFLVPGDFNAPAERAPDSFDEESAPFYDPGIPEKPKGPVKPRPRLLPHS